MPRFSSLSSTESHGPVIELWLPLAQRGHAKAQYVLGRLFAEGKVTSKNLWEAHMWLLKSAEQGNGDAQTYLGIMYSRGNGVKQNYSKAARWMQLAAAQGIIKAQFYLSRMYAQGLGVPQSYIYAYMWAMLTATGGKPNSPPQRPRNEKLRTHALNTLEGFTRKMSKEEACAAIRMAKKWRARYYD